MFGRILLMLLVLSAPMISFFGCESDARLTTEPRIVHNKVVVMEYTMTDQDGNVLEEVAAEKPSALLYGQTRVFEELERALLGKAAGERLIVNIPAEKAFGSRDESLVKKMPRQEVHAQSDLRVGMKLRMQDTESIVMVVAFDDEFVTVDGNHPAAGKSLRYEVHVLDVRDATREELQHGHPHGIGGYTH